ncbi:MAG: hypothetical protein NT159_20265 [Proteobacteria bacterium]|nr:hypothetical protein [Pseudomonadota bacterium]
MKNLFSMIQIVNGILAVLIGSAAVLNPTHNPAVIAAGVAALGVGAICLWVGKACWSQDAVHSSIPQVMLPP